MPLILALQVVTSAPVGVLGTALGQQQTQIGCLSVGSLADLCVVDPQQSWLVEPAALHSQAKSTPFAGSTLPARVRHTVVDGKLVFSRS